MKNFLDINQIPGLASSKDALIHNANVDLSEFMHKMPIEQKVKYNNIVAADFIKMYSIPVKYSQDNCPCNGPIKELFNFTVDGPEQNYNLGTGPFAEQIKTIAGDLYEHHHLPFFRNLLNIIPEQLKVAWIFFYTQGASVTEAHGHGHTTIMVHVLLEDIKNGEFVIDVNGETRKISKQGEYFIFNGILPHGATLTGDDAKFLSFAMNSEDLVA